MNAVCLPFILTLYEESTMISFTIRKWMASAVHAGISSAIMHNHEGLIRGVFPICVLDPLPWLSSVSSWIGCFFFYSLSIIDWFPLLRCLLILYYILFFLQDCSIGNGCLWLDSTKNWDKLPTNSNSREGALMRQGGHQQEIY